MVVRIHNVSKWKKLQPGEVLELKGQSERRVRIELNCPAPTRLDLIQSDGNPVFLAVVQGLETVEFVAGATVQLVATSEDEVWYFTSDGEQVAAKNVQAKSFTKIAQRRTRNPELERMMFKMQQNMERRFAMLEAENAELRRHRKRKEESPGDEPVSDGTSAEGAGAAAPAAGVAAEPAPTGAEGDGAVAT